MLLGKYEYTGNISTSGVVFDYFPYNVSTTDLEMPTYEIIPKWKKGSEDWRVICEINKMNMDPEVLYRPFKTLSHGERTKVMLAVLFSGENDFLIIDEPTNHLDAEARECVKEYLASKKGFILISHDRDILDAVTDHILILNRKTIEVQAGNFSSWWENKQKRDSYSKSENEKHLREIQKLKSAADKTSRWAEKSENSKIGYDPIEDHDRSINARSYIGSKTKKLKQRVKVYEKRINREIKEKENLLQDLEEVEDLKLMPLFFNNDTFIYTKDYCFKYATSDKNVINNLCFELKKGERVFLQGQNGSGKSTFIKQILSMNENIKCNTSKDISEGELRLPTGMKISYISQDTSFLRGYLKDYCMDNGLDKSLMLSILRKLDFERVQFEKPMESYSEGQKKKVLIATGLLVPAHLYIWDEPLNYIDVFSRIQIEDLILKYKPTMLIVDHDAKFRDKIATRIVELK